MTVPTPPQIPAGWYPDPSRGNNPMFQRFWDGFQWTAETTTVTAPAAPVQPVYQPVQPKVDAPPVGAMQEPEKFGPVVPTRPEQAPQHQSFRMTPSGVAKPVDPNQYTPGYGYASGRDNNDARNEPYSFDAIESVKRGYRNMLDFSGRATPGEYWWFVLYTFVALIASVMVLQVIAMVANVAIIGAASIGAGQGMGIGMGGGFIYMIIMLLILVGYFVGFFLPLLSLGFRRLHDTDHPGWYVFIPAMNSVLFDTIGVAAQSTTVLQIGSLVGLGIGIWLIVLYCQPSDWGRNSFGYPSR